MPTGQDVLDELQQMKRDLHHAAKQSWTWKTTVEDHGHGYISLNIPADQEHRRRTERRQQQTQNDSSPGS